jgi:hypothetical protein
VLRFILISGGEVVSPHNVTDKVVVGTIIEDHPRFLDRGFAFDNCPVIRQRAPQRFRSDVKRRAHGRESRRSASPPPSAASDSAHRARSPARCWAAARDAGARSERYAAESTAADDRLLPGAGAVRAAAVAPPGRASARAFGFGTRRESGRLSCWGAVRPSAATFTESVAPWLWGQPEGP